MVSVAGLTVIMIMTMITIIKVVCVASLIAGFCLLVGLVVTIGLLESPAEGITHTRYLSIFLKRIILKKACQSSYYKISIRRLLLCEAIFRVL